MVSWECGGSGSAEPGSGISHLALGTREGQSAEGGGSSRDRPSAEDPGSTKMGKEDPGKILLLRQCWAFGLQQDPTLCQREKKELGTPWGSFITPMPFCSTRNVPSW